jgi:hypothetical protein
MLPIDLGKDNSFPLDQSATAADYFVLLPHGANRYKRL